MNERELIEACREGDKVAEKELYQRYSGKLYTLCIRYAGNKEDALDYMHDAMLKGISSLSRFKYLGEGSFYRWLSRLTVNNVSSTNCN